MRLRWTPLLSVITERAEASRPCGSGAPPQPTSTVTFTKFLPHFSPPDCPQHHLQRLHAAPVPFTLLFTLLLLFLKSVCSSRAGDRRLFIFCRLASRRPCVVVPPFIFILLLLIMELISFLFYFILLYY